MVSPIETRVYARFETRVYARFPGEYLIIDDELVAGGGLLGEGG